MFNFELEEESFGTVVGIDEVGRGAWAGPVVAFAVVIDRSLIKSATVKMIRDSKQIKESDRYKIDNILSKSSAVTSALGVASVEEIGAYNILGASLLAMQRAYQNLPVSVDTALVDGLHAPDIGCTVKTIVRGDTKSISIAAASIFAKVFRDRLMISLSTKFPQYQWERNKGYGTAGHKVGLETSGVTIHHRNTFAPIVLFSQER